MRQLGEIKEKARHLLVASYSYKVGTPLTHTLNNLIASTSAAVQACECVCAECVNYNLYSACILNSNCNTSLSKQIMVAAETKLTSCYQNGIQVEVEVDLNKPPLVLGLQPSALVDHVAKVDSSLLSKIPGQIGGSIPVAWEEVEQILSEVRTHIAPTKDDPSPIRTLGGGSVANTIRGLSACFGVNSGLLGACGDDEQGKLFINHMSSKNVELSRMKTKKGATAQCVCLVDADGNRTMRPCLSQAVRLKADELIEENFMGSKWLVMRFAAINLELINAAARIAKRVGLLVSLDLASFEMVRSHKSDLIKLLESGNIDLCFANEDEAMEIVSGKQDTSPEAALDYLATYCQWAVVTLGSKGCIAKHGNEIVKLSAIGEAQACDATGAGDLFASGFIYGLINNLSLEDCCKVGSCSGGSVIRSLGGDVTPENRLWMYKQMQIKDLPTPKFCI